MQQVGPDKHWDSNTILINSLEQQRRTHLEQTLNPVVYPLEEYVRPVDEP